MTARERLQRIRLGALALNPRVGANMLRGLVVSIFLHSAVVSIWALLPESEKPLARIITFTDTTFVFKQKPDRSQYAPPVRPEKPVLPDVMIPIPTETEYAEPELEPEELKDLTVYQEGVRGGLEPDSIADNSGVNWTGDIDSSNLAGLVKPWEVFTYREVEPAPLSTNPRPAYPDMARKAGIEAKVSVWIYIDVEGNVTDWNVIDVTVPGLGFEDEVEKIISDWKFTPALQGNQPVAVWVNVPFRFTIKR